MVILICIFYLLHLSKKKIPLFSDKSLTEKAFCSYLGGYFVRINNQVKGINLNLILKCPAS